LKTLGACFALCLLAPGLGGAECPGETEALRDRWHDMWGRLERRGATGDHLAVWAALRASYCESHRAYHTLAHIDHALAELESVRDLAEDPVAVEFALWFHDVVYTIGSRNNEQESARRARAAAVELGMSEPWADRVSGLVLATRHGSVPEDVDGRLVVDIDLSILGQPRARFDAYEAEIRAEYAPVIEARGAAAFDAGRAALLKRFLDRPTIYSTDRFQRKYEAAARANLEHSIEQLETRPWTGSDAEGDNRSDSRER
jgi:predicted metal-dependent HD superfamily phosphohydrolase